MQVDLLSGLAPLSKLRLRWLHLFFLALIVGCDLSDDLLFSLTFGCAGLISAMLSAPVNR